MKKLDWVPVVFLAIPVILGAYIVTQQPKLSLNAQQFGLMLLRGGYRSYFLSFADAQAPDGRLVIIQADGSWKYGYRIWPRFSHVDVRKLKLHE